MYVSLSDKCFVFLAKFLKCIYDIVPFHFSSFKIQGTMNPKRVIISRRSFQIPISIIILSCLINCCTVYKFRSNYKDIESLEASTDSINQQPYLKAHLNNGEVCVFSGSWAVDSVLNTLNGIGYKYDFNRKNIQEGVLSIPLDEVVIFETNRALGSNEHRRIRALTILTGIDVSIGAFCLANPKACFGSCPTFYIDENVDLHHADAEGFSSAVLPSMEYFDIDALDNTALNSNTFSLTMKNEAFETHCINDIKLLAYPRNPGQRIYQSPDNEFFLCEGFYELDDNEMNKPSTQLLSEQDNHEFFSLTDEKNIHAREEIILNFHQIKNTEDLGLLIDFRQSLLSTYLFYSSMGYMGNDVGHFFTKLELDEALRMKIKDAIDLLGGIDIYLFNEENSNWELQNSCYEAGPIAVNKQLIPLQKTTPSSDVKIKIVLNKGLWRIDYVALSKIKKKVDPIEISPGSILNKGVNDARAMKEIDDPENYLISFPGNEYTFTFELPENDTDYELFLYSKGYYLEWMRNNWLKDKNLFKLNLLLKNPEKYYRKEARKYKEYENTMEEVFWSSRINTKTYNAYED